MVSNGARIFTNFLTVAILIFVGYIIYIKATQKKDIDFRAIFGKFNFRK